jgi:hypothetical protein
MGLLRLQEKLQQKDREFGGRAATNAATIQQLESRLKDSESSRLELETCRRRMEKLAQERDSHAASAITAQQGKEVLLLLCTAPRTCHRWRLRDNRYFLFKGAFEGGSG